MSKSTKVSQIGKKANADSTAKTVWKFPLQRRNYYYILLGIGAIILGYILMATGITEEPALPDGKWNNVLAVWIAPVILIIGYCVLIPMGIMKNFNKKAETNTEKTV